MELSKVLNQLINQNYKTSDIFHQIVSTGNYDNVLIEKLRKRTLFFLVTNRITIVHPYLRNL